MGRFSLSGTEQSPRARGCGFGGPFQVVALALMVWGLALMASPAIPGQSSDFVLYFDSVGAFTPEIPVTVRALIDNPGGPLAGWSIAVCHDERLEIVGAGPGQAVLIHNGGQSADFSNIVIFPGAGVRQGVVIDFTSTHLLPADLGHEVAILQYALVGNPLPKPQVSYCNQLFPGDFSLSETLVVAPGGVAIDPTTVVGILGLKFPFTRGDANQDGRVDLADGIGLLGILMMGEPVLCEDACDHNDDGSFNFADAIASLHSSFGNAPAPPPPGLGSCDQDPTEDLLNCGDYVTCP